MDVAAIEQILLEDPADTKALPQNSDTWRSMQTNISYELGGFSRVGTETILQQFGGLKSSFNQSLLRLVDEMGTVPGAGTAWTKYRLTAERLIRRNYIKSYELGAKYTGNRAYIDGALTKADLRFLYGAAKAEMNFFKRFAVKTLTGTSKIPRALQTKMYADSLKTQFWNGFVGASPEDMNIYWRLGMPRYGHCPDCLSIAAGSPYTKVTLPSVPGAGHTRCLFRCFCSLELPFTRAEDQFGDFEGAPPSAHVTMLDGIPVAPNVQDMFTRLYDEINRMRQMQSLTSGAERLNYIQLHRTLVKQVIDLQTGFGVRAVPTYGVKELVQVVQGLSDQGLSVFLTSEGVITGQVLWTVNSMSLRMGEIIRVIDDNTVLMRIMGVEVQISLDESIVMGRK